MVPTRSLNQLCTRRDPLHITQMSDFWRKHATPSSKAPLVSTPASQAYQHFSFSEREEKLKC